MLQLLGDSPLEHWGRGMGFEPAAQRYLFLCGSQNWFGMFSRSMASYIVLMMYIYSFLYCLVDMMSPNSVSVIMELELRCCLLYFFY